MKLINKPLYLAAAVATVFAQPLLAQETAAPAASAPKPPSYAEIGVATAPVAEAYVAAYSGRDWDTLETLLTEDASFQDPTATHVFGNILSEGRAAMMERFRVGYAVISHMEFVKTRHFVSAETAVYEGALHWAMDIGDGTIVDSVTPMVILLTVKDGKVVRHRDYIDYAPFLKALAKARKAKE